MLTAYVDPIPANLSWSLHRVANALRRYAPSDVTVVDNPKQANFQVIHVTSVDALQAIQAPRYAIIQYCHGKDATSHLPWQDAWRKADVVWSYYDLRSVVPQQTEFLHTPLGIDDVFCKPFSPNAHRPIGILTSGFVGGPQGEAIEEAALAAEACRLPFLHIGPRWPALIPKLPRTWQYAFGISDEALAAHYRRSRWVSGLRHVEGFELPVVEGLACGARPIVFDHTETRKWFEGHVTFVPECYGSHLVAILVKILQQPPQPITTAERDEILQKFAWERIINQFWAVAVGALAC